MFPRSLHHAARACLILLLLAATASCGGPVITKHSFGGRCLTYSPGNMEDSGSCGYQANICDQFKTVVYEDYAGRQDCIAACTDMQTKLYKDYLLGECRAVVRYAWQNCNNYCRANYQ